MNQRCNLPVKLWEEVQSLVDNQTRRPIIRLRDKLAAAERRHERVNRDQAELIIELGRRIAELEAALRPFAEIFPHLPTDAYDSVRPVTLGATLADYRFAAAALKCS
jgi:hypothetical protein